MVVSFVGSALAAQAAVSPYISFSGGASLMQDARIGYTDSSNKEKSGHVKFDTGYVLDGAVGLDFSNIPLRTEIEVSYQENDIDGVDDVVKSGVGSKQKTTSLMWNGYLDISTSSNFKPYVLAGIGGVDVDLGDVNTRFAYQFGAGFGYKILDHLFIDLKYKFFMTDPFNYNKGGTKYRIDDLSSHQVQLGLRYRF